MPVQRMIGWRIGTLMPIAFASCTPAAVGVLCRPIGKASYRVPIWRVHAAGLGRYRGRARVHRIVIPDCELRRSHARPGSRGPRAAADLPIVIGDLLYLMDVFRLGRIRVTDRV